VSLGDFVIDRSGEGAIARQPFEDFWVFEDGKGFNVHDGGIITTEMYHSQNECALS